MLVGMVGVVQGRGRLDTRVSYALAGLTVVGLAGLGVLTAHQLRVWHDSETLWSSALMVDPTSAVALNNFGRILLDKGQLTEATEHFQKALQLKPDFAEAYNNVGFVLMRQGKLREAVEYYRKAIELQPTLSKAHGNLDAALKWLSLEQR